MKARNFNMANKQSLTHQAGGVLEHEGDTYLQSEFVEDEGRSDGVQKTITEQLRRVLEQEEHTEEKTPETEEKGVLLGGDWETRAARMTQMECEDPMGEKNAVEA
ncbi:hypothetical protein NDU88_001570 [Pleurodeles waltl]|uniref:Uncharacterized protein n=1 Tax=Pleurodeles waltl TaxID=8319 RepID=A0AAV7S939_PLEWA|nr:hypothetical protein NDU88_001570 [Pleurodeles waltl]